MNADSVGCSIAAGLTFGYYTYMGYIWGSEGLSTPMAIFMGLVAARDIYRAGRALELLWNEDAEVEAAEAAEEEHGRA